MRHIYFLFIILYPAICQGQVVKSFKQAADRVDVTLSEGTLSMQIK
jgi:alpha-D-xyloside xylohydrolase